ncbi:MAG: hypothetical protein L0Y61_05365 [Epsilonproteobacteria bacterium]|nr:hypothetical protein [Campylobacterota bacterium]
MEKYKNKQIFFEGRGDKLDKDEILKYLSQNEAIITQQIDEADIIIDTSLPYLEDKIYLKSIDGIPVIQLNEIEKEFSDAIDIDSVLMAIKISKDQERLKRLINNDFFSDDIFLLLLKFYDWCDEGIYDTDENRDVSTAIAKRFCTLQGMNHNIKHSPTALYYTALETTNGKLLETLYLIPEYKINNRNAISNQPLSIHEMVALNPHISKPLMMQILKNSKKNELKFLASNPNIGEFIKKELLKTNDKEIISCLIIANNLPQDEYKTLLNGEYKNIILSNISLNNNEIFEYLFNSELNKIELLELSKNNTLTSEQIDILLELNDVDITINILKSEQLNSKHIDLYLAKDNKFYNIALSHNKKLSQNGFNILAKLDDLDIDISLSLNPKIPKEIIEILYRKNEDFINQGLASNSATPIDKLMQLQLDNRYSVIIAKNETYKEYSRNSLGIGNEYNSEFKRNTYEHL